MNPIAKRTITSLSVAAALVLAIIFIPLTLLLPVAGVLGALVIMEYATLLAKKLPVKSFGYWFWLLVGGTILAGSFGMLPVIAFGYGNLTLLYVLAVVKISDMGGFAIGVAFGKHKLCPSISPNKSWEGLGGSVLASVLMSCAFMPITGFAWPKAIAMGVTAALIGTFGDLTESKFKRWVGVKDSSTMKFTNGMGGFLDMFDSLVFAPAVFYPFL